MFSLLRVQTEPGGLGQVEGQMNERIVATALYYLDSHNVTPSNLAFRMRTSEEQDDLQERCGQDAFRLFERVYGTCLRMDNSDSAFAVQNYGNLETRQGRLLAFPNVL